MIKLLKLNVKGIDICKIVYWEKSNFVLVCCIDKRSREEVEFFYFAVILWVLELVVVLISIKFMLFRDNIFLDFVKCL